MKTKQTNYSRFGSVVHMVVYLCLFKTVLEVQETRSFKTRTLCTLCQQELALALFKDNSTTILLSHWCLYLQGSYREWRPSSALTNDKTMLQNFAAKIVCHAKFFNEHFSF